MQNAVSTDAIKFKVYDASLAFLSVTDICAAAGLSCGYTCDNSTGTFVCVCPSGYELEANQENCTGINGKQYDLRTIYFFLNPAIACIIIFASQGFRSWSPFYSPLADLTGISDPRVLDFYWMQQLLAASNQIAANNRSRKHCVYAVEM